MKNRNEEENYYFFSLLCFHVCMNGVDLFEFCMVGGSIFLAMCAVSYIRNDIKKGRRTIISLIPDPVETYFQDEARKKKIFENIKK